MKPLDDLLDPGTHEPVELWRLVAISLVIGTPIGFVIGILLVRSGLT